MGRTLFGAVILGLLFWLSIDVLYNLPFCCVTKYRNFKFHSFTSYIMDI